MDTSAISGQWVNVDCSSRLAVACMRQQNYTAPLCSPGPWKEGQIIYSPGFPDDASIPCDYLFSVNTGKKIEVEVLFVEANSCCDRLVLIENYIGGTVIANLTGEISDRRYTTKSSNFMRVSWQPDGGVNVRGFMMRYREVPCVRIEHYLLECSNRDEKTAHIVNATCRSGFELFRNGECRGNYTRLTPYWDASPNPSIASCKQIQAQPIIIRDAMDQSYWSSKATGGYALLGLVCNSTSKQWNWADGTVLNYKPPSGYATDMDKDCVPSMNWAIQSNGYWYSGAAHNTFTADVFCSIPDSQPVPSPNGCESFDDDSDDAICYQIATTAENFRNAQMVCKNVGGDLASIHNDRENTFVRRLAVSRQALNGVLIGGLLSGNDKAWTDGSAWDYDHFYPGFPINGLGQCLVLDTQGTSGEWMNVDCNNTVAVACERQQNFTTPVCPTEPPKEGQFVVSPGFPFDASTPCDYMLMVDAGKKVQMEILMLEANTCCDRLVIYEDYFAGKVIANVTGEFNERVYTTSTSNFMKVSWQPNGGVNVRGMMHDTHIHNVVNFADNASFPCFELNAFIRNGKFTTQTAKALILSYSNQSLAMLALLFFKPVTSVLGAAIRVDRVENPTDLEVDLLHEKYCNALVDLFEKIKALYNVPDDQDINFY
ncbi:hypothetical protein PRIPAC_84263 [Pristionchus pacificus]|uniref:CUB domain-containing protein n=1 Tax=Pristionchus pacificus TaxID=54126 RepID=A0A2A6BUF3_PRIPA|nr:hypothetical protein PRIPAC_84263 [Pristionchus pacificus]|eukprot:PDM69535.1 CUB domain-containing protein [Pristionchus pacificus]